MLARVALLVIVYVLIGAVAGFSILLCIGLLSAIYGLIYPSIDTWRATNQGDKQSVS
jgi:preprotein translocase subunit SecF